MRTNAKPFATGRLRCGGAALVLVALLTAPAAARDGTASLGPIPSDTTPFATRKVPTVDLKSEGTVQASARAKATTTARPTKPKKTKDRVGSTMTMAIFLDRLMQAESSGIDTAKNPRSSATGPFQFIESTWIDVMERHFPRLIKDRDRRQILAMRTDRKVARRAAEAFTRDNAAILAADGHPPTFPNLRLAFLLGPGAASRVLGMEPNAPVAPVLGSIVVRANPFLARMTANDLLAKSARDLSVPPTTLAGIKPPKGAAGRRARRKSRGPRIRVRCNLRRPSCRRWLALKRKQLRSKNRRTRRAALKATR